MNATPAKKKTGPNLYLLGAIYGLLWGCVALGIIAFMSHGDFRPCLEIAHLYLPAGIGTGLVMTQLLGPRLSGARGWKLLPYGALALLIGTQFFALYMLVGAVGQNLAYNVTEHLELLDNMGGLRNGMLMFIWYPLYGFGSIIPLFLAIWNCRDLRDRMDEVSVA